MSTPYGELNFRQIEPGDIVTKFSLGSKEFTPLKTFLRKDALNFHQSNIAKTYVIVDEKNRVWSYISLVCSQIIMDSDCDHICLDDCPRASSYNDYPAIKIARLAVDKRLLGKGYGENLVEIAISLTKDKIMPIAGCRFIIVDSKQESIDFYKKMGILHFPVYNLMKKSQYYDIKNTTKMSTKDYNKNKL